jgi:hypothetical protein
MARKPKDARILHGHRVVTGPELRATFEAADDPDDPIRVRRRVIHGVVLVLLLGLIAGGVITAFAIINGHLKLPAPAASEAPQSACPAATYDYVPPEKVNVNVFNSTSRPGLARTVADELLARKFVVGNVANTEAGYRGVAAVVSGAAGQSAAFTVQRNVPGSDYFQDGRSDASVDVILSGDYKELAAADRVDQTPGKLSCPRESRRIADDAKWPVLPTATPSP